jgi:hypothetical protein
LLDVSINNHNPMRQESYTTLYKSSYSLKFIPEQKRNIRSKPVEGSWIDLPDLEKKEI